MNAQTLASPNAAQSSSIPAGRLFGHAFLGGAIAAVVNAIIFFGAHAASLSLEAEFQPGTRSALSVVPVIISSIMPALFASIVALFLRKPKAGPTIFAVIAGVFLLLSMGGPASIAGADMGTRVVLALMHGVAGVGIGGMLYRALKG